MNTNIATCNLKSNNIIVYIVNNNKTKKFLENNYWIKVLEKKAKPVCRILQVVVYAVFINYINLVDKNVIIKKLYTKNITLILILKIR